MIRMPQGVFQPAEHILPQGVQAGSLSQGFETNLENSGGQACRTLGVSDQDPAKYRGSPTSAYVYAVTDNGRRHKIGMAVNMMRRLSTLQTGHSDPLRLTDILTVARGRERIVERAIHKDLGYRRLRGEWFEIDCEDVRTLFAFARIRWVEDQLLGF